MYDFDDQIPDSDAEIYMSLDEIIKLRGIKRPGSVKSATSHRSARSTKSKFSTYSNKSRRSTYSNKSRRSAYSNKSRRSIHSVHSNARQAYYSEGAPSIIPQYDEENRLISLHRRYVPRAGYKVLKRPGVYTPANQIQVYRNKVRQAVKFLSGPTFKGKQKVLNRFQNVRPYQKFKYYSLAHNDGVMNRFPPTDIIIDIDNSQTVHNPIRKLRTNNSPTRNSLLTRQSLALFNQMNAKSHGSSIHSHRSQFTYKRHSVRGSLNPALQMDIADLQKRHYHTSAKVKYDMNFVCTPDSTGIPNNDRFSAYG